MRFNYFSSVLALSLMCVAPAAVSSDDGIGIEPLSSACRDVPPAVIEEMDFLTFYSTEERAVKAAAEIDERLFDVEVRTAAASPEWVVRAVYRELPTPELHAQQVKSMKLLAEKNGSRDHGVGCSTHRSRR